MYPRLPVGLTHHPGVLLRDAVLPALCLSVSQAARDLRVTRQTLHRVLGGYTAITPEMAIRLERLCGVSASFWLDRQHRHDVQRVLLESEALFDRIPSRALPENIKKQIGAANGN